MPDIVLGVLGLHLRTKQTACAAGASIIGEERQTIKKAKHVVRLLVPTISRKMNHGRRNEVSNIKQGNHGMSH